MYDPVGERLIVFGGFDGVHMLDDTWQLSLAGGPAWSPLPTAQRPPRRRMPAMAYDPSRRRVVLTGGQDTLVVPLADSSWTANLHIPIIAALRTRKAAFVEDALRLHFKEASEHLAAAWTAEAPAR